MELQNVKAFCAVRSSPDGTEWLHFRAIGETEKEVIEAGFQEGSPAARDFPLLRIVSVSIQELEAK